MPVASTEAAVNSILTRLKTAWDAQGGVIPDMQYYNSHDDAPSGAVSWARAQIVHVDSREATLANDVGNRRFRRVGQLIVEIYTPAGAGLTEPYDRAKVVQDAFEGVRTGSDGIRYSQVRINEVGIQQSWFMLNVLAEFEYDELK
jgi:hypothetical protein